MVLHVWSTLFSHLLDEHLELTKEEKRTLAFKKRELSVLGDPETRITKGEEDWAKLSEWFIKNRNKSLFTEEGTLSPDFSFLTEKDLSFQKDGVWHKKQKVEDLHF